ncbi:MAG: hypothetical protein H0W02_15585 [Ktedonobacteraceae bacterium]|nr:hypothetical protein [Ktedonobacteraceae bacterium]
MDILYLVDRLENLIATSRRMPLMNQIIIKEPDILNVVDQMRTTIPEEIKQARRVIQEKERIIAQAQADATALLSKAREESERSMNREGLLRAAEERTKEMIRRAETQAEQLKADADAYVAETLRGLREHLASVEMDVSRTILSIEKGLESLQEDSGQGIDEDGVNGLYSQDNTLYEESEEGLPPARSVPRRASLAADTMGGPMLPQDATPWMNDRA